MAAQYRRIAKSLKDLAWAIDTYRNSMGDSLQRLANALKANEEKASHSFGAELEKIPIEARQIIDQCNAELKRHVSIFTEAKNIIDDDFNKLSAAFEKMTPSSEVRTIINRFAYGHALE